MSELEQGIPVHAIAPSKAGKPGYQEIKGQLKFDEIVAFVDTRKKLGERMNSHLEPGEYLLLQGTLNIFLKVDERLITSLESAVDGNGATESAAGVDLLYALNLIHF